MKSRAWRTHKPLPLSSLKKKLKEQVKKICRERMPCIMKDQGFGACGGVIQASHIKSEGAWPNLKLDPYNIFPMCWRHHFKKWHIDTTECAKWFAREFAPMDRYLEKAKRKSKDLNNRSTLEMLYTASRRGFAEYADAYNSLP